MTRIQYWTLIAGSSLVALFLLLQLIYAHKSQAVRMELLGAEQVVSQGRMDSARLQNLASRIYQVAMQTQDQGLKDLLARQNIVGPTQGPATSTPPASTSR